MSNNEQCPHCGRRDAMPRDDLRDAAVWMRSNWGRVNPFRKNSEDWRNWESAEMEQLAMIDAAIDGSDAPTGSGRRDAVPTSVSAVDRFLAWKLPLDFAPDCGISFDGRGKDARGYDKGWPIGTNLLTAEQARAMFEHCLAPQPAAQPYEIGEEINRAHNETQPAAQTRLSYCGRCDRATKVIDGVCEVCRKLVPPDDIPAAATDEALRVADETVGIRNRSLAYRKLLTIVIRERDELRHDIAQYVQRDSDRLAQVGQDDDLRATNPIDAQSADSAALADTKERP